MQLFTQISALSILVSVTMCANNNVFGGRSCLNPNNHRGTCLAIHDCHIMRHSELKFIEESKCGGGYGSTPFVCCTTDTGFQRFNHLDQTLDESESRRSRANRKNTTKPNQKSKASVSVEPSRRGVFETNSINAEDLLPHPPACGGVFINSRIYTGENADLHEFPWLAHLEYSKADPRVEVICAGSLINTRYVLTAAHCVQGDVISYKGELVAVRLGLYDYTQNIRSAEYGQRVKVAETIVHKYYLQREAPRNDVALLRLEKNVEYSPGVKPICLPSVEPLQDHELSVGTEMVVVGWGVTEDNFSSPIKQKLVLPLADQEYCREQYGRMHFKIKSTHLCAGGAEANKDSCRGDSGAPLMHYRYGVWVLEGIVSFGHQCGRIGWPGVYTRISSFTSWILQHLEP